MKRPLATVAWLLTPLLMLPFATPAQAAASGVNDRAHFFSPGAVTQADEIIHQINQRHHKDVLVETWPDIPQDMRQEYEQLGKERFFEQWAGNRARGQGVDGILILIARDPPHLQVWDGNKTQQRLFPTSDIDTLKRQLADHFRQRQYDEGLLQAVRYIQQQMDANVPAAGRSGAVPPVYSPQTNRPLPVPRQSWGIGGLACLIIGVILVIMLIRGIFGRSGGGYYGGGRYIPPGGAYPPGGYPPGGYPPGAYPPAGGYAYGGGGGGFGRGFLGGLLGGALGGYAANKWEQNQQGGYAPPPAGSQDNSSGVDTGGTSGGADFGAADQSSGADFGGGGGADFGGGGGSDFGGGDSGASSGSDF